MDSEVDVEGRVRNVLPVFQWSVYPKVQLAEDGRSGVRRNACEIFLNS